MKVLLSFFCARTFEPKNGALRKNDRSTTEHLASEEAQGKILSYDKSILPDLYLLKFWQCKSLCKAAMLDEVRRRVLLFHHKMRPSRSASHLLKSFYMNQNRVLHEEFRLVCPLAVIYLLYLLIYIRMHG